MKRLLILLAGLALAGCSQGHVTTTGSAATGRLPPPTHVMVTDFALTPGEVQLDQGVSARFLRAANGAPSSAAQEEAARETQAALAETLASKLASYGLPVERLAAGAMAPPGSLLVHGQIDTINEGNRTRRTLIGFGAGKSSIRAEAQLYYVSAPGQPMFLRGFTGTADSGHMSGAAETMGAGAVAQRAATSAAASGAMHAGAETRRTTDTANADKLGTALAREIGNYAVAEGWIPAGAVR